MRTPSRCLAGLITATLLFSFGGAFAFCAGCGEATMPCCRDDGSQSQRISTESCCDFQMSAAPTPSPAILSSSERSAQQSRSAIQPAEELTPGAPDSLCACLPEIQPSPPENSTPPLFILNASLLR